MIEVCDLQKSFGDVPVLRGVNLSVKKGGRTKEKGLFVDRLVMAKVPAGK